MSEDLGQKEQDKCEENKGSKSEREPPGISFDPPVYRQRYSVVFEMVKNYNPKKVLDFGCAECKLLRFLISNETSIEQLVGVDIDGELLEQSKFRIEPLISDYLQPKQTPFNVSMFQGSISQADDRFCNFDLISCVEIIEHLIPEHLDCMPEVLFGQLSPKVAIVTTPNADFNVLFPNLEGFRHWDHKFEWTRVEFQDWATSQANKYGYNVSFRGIGHGPMGTEHLGCCSQMALFERNDLLCIPKEAQSFGQPYRLIKEVDYPFRKCTTTEEEKILYEVERLLWVWSQPSPYEEELDNESTEDNMPKSFELKRLFEMQSLRKLCGTMERLHSVLQSSRFQLTENGSSVLWCQPSWESDESEDSLDWNVDNDNTEHTSNIPVTDNSVKETENWDSDEDNSDVNHINNYSNVCWNTATDNDTCQYWDGIGSIGSESALTDNTSTENDNNACGSKEFQYQFRSGRHVKDDDDDDDDYDNQECGLKGEGDDQLHDLEDDGLIWISTDDTSLKDTNKYMHT